jgi:hypothetical protein
MRGKVLVVMAAMLLPLLALAQDDAAAAAEAATKVAEAVEDATGTEPAIQLVESWAVTALNYLVAILASLLTALVPLVALWVRKRWKLDVEDRELQLLTRYVALGVARAEEWAYNQVKAGMSQPSPKGKLDAAVSAIRDAIEQSGIRNRTQKELEVLVESWLGLDREAQQGKGNSEAG